MDKIKTQDCYTTFAMKGSGMDLEIQKMVEDGYLDKHIGMVVLTVEQFNEAIADAKAEGIIVGINDIIK